MSRRRNFASTVGAVFIDIGKLAIGGLIFGAVLRGSVDPMQAVKFGIVIAVPLVVIGIMLVLYSKE